MDVRIIPTDMPTRNPSQKAFLILFFMFFSLFYVINNKSYGNN